MEKLIVTADKLKVGKLVLPRGSEFEASYKEAKLLKHIGKAADASEKFARTVDIPAKVKPKVEEEDEEIVPLSASRYLRRDMTAEDGQTGEAKPQSSSHPAPQPKKRRSRY